jgi:enoyl-CoA hydratase
MDLKYIRTGIESGVCRIRFHRPDKLNAINPAVLRELETSIAACEEDDAIRVVVLEGGEKAFVAGADVGEMAEGGVTDAQRLTDLTMRVQERLADLPKPTIAAIAGYALGAGCEIALCCDFRIGAENAVMGLPEIKLGIMPGGGGTQRLPRLIHPGVAARMILLGENVKAQEAERIGLLDKVTSIDQLANEALALAAKLAAMPVVAVRAAKTAMRRGLGVSLKDGLQIEQNLFCMLFGTRDKQEGMAAFLEKRKPVFEGK